MPTTIQKQKTLGWLGYIEDFTTQLYRDYHKPWNKDPY